ncbi:MAG TPA: permease, partial [Spirochaetota bacterium]|nr:permease [Spirochaetota bacterium]
ARAIGAVGFSVVIGGIMHFIYRNEETAKVKAAMNMPAPEVKRPLWKDIVYFTSMVAILIFANWAKPGDTGGFFHAIYAHKWMITAVSAGIFAVVLVLWYEMAWWKMAILAAIVTALSVLFGEHPVVPFAAGAIGLALITATDAGEQGEWFSSTWDFAKQITPLLLGGILVSGFLLGRPGSEGIIPAEWVSAAVGGNSFAANFFASVVGAFMYFATLTEIPIVQALLGAGMGKGPALALLLAGPALSLPNMLVIRSYIGTQKTVVYCSLVVVMATISGMVFGTFF